MVLKRTDILFSAAFLMSVSRTGVHIYGVTLVLMTRGESFHYDEK